MADYNARHGGLVAFQANRSTSRARDARGRFLPGGIQDLNRQAARTLQGHVVQTLRASPLARPNVSTGRLVRATADARNIVADQQGWGVGKRSYLDTSIAKYWRTIEEGSVATWSRGGMRGMEIYGMWGGSIRGYYTNRWGEQPRAGGPWRHLAVQGKLRGLSPAAAKKLKLKPMIVRNEIAPHRYYATAIETYNPGREWARSVEEYLYDTVRRRLTNDLRRTAWGPGYTS